MKQQRYLGVWGGGGGGGGGGHLFNEMEVGVYNMEVWHLPKRGPGVT